MKLNRNYWPVLLFTAIAFGVLLGGKLSMFNKKEIVQSNPHKSKLNRLIDFIERDYVDYVNTDSIVDLTVNGILEKLDPHSVYIPKHEQAFVAESMRGDFVGIGVNFYIYKDTVAVIKPLPGGPSEKAGIQSGDRILFADTYQLYGKKLPNDSLYSKLKGTVGSSITLTVFRKSQNKRLKFTLKREVVPIKSVDVAMMIANEIGYIKVNRFSETTYQEFKSGLDKVVAQGAKRVVIDLRDNGGGYLEKAVQMADEFLEEGALIVFTKNKKGRIDKTKATKKGIFEKGKVFVLLNENSASASEIFAGAIQDNDRGLIVGRRSFGKGLVQREMELGDGSVVRLTVARYFTPSGRSIQKPYGNGTEDYYNEFDKRFASGELYERDSIKIKDSLIFKTKKGRTVYGGGGIVPDIFVPLQNKHSEDALELMMQSGVVSYFVFEELDRDRKTFSNLNYENFVVKMEYTDLYFNNFQNYLNTNGINIPLNKNKPLVKRYLMGEFARQLFDDEKYYEIILKNDLMVQEVLKQ